MKRHLVSMLVFILLVFPMGAFALMGTGPVNDIAYSPDGKHLAVASDIGVWIYDAQTGSEQALIPATQGNVFRCIDFSPNGHVLAVIGDMGEIQLWITDHGH